MTKERQSLQRLIERIIPGGTLLHIRRLKGGISSRMHILEIAKPDGTTTSVSLRRSEPNETDHGYVRPDQMARHFHILQVIEHTGLPAPRPILLDEQGEYFGIAAMVVSHLPGKPLMKARNMRAWSAELARAASEIHAITPANFDLSSLELHVRDRIRRNLDDWRDNSQENSLASQIHSALERTVDGIEFPPPVLIHGDYWPGNTIWQHGKITGIVDWGTAALGDPRIDIAECRMVNVFNTSIDAAEHFTDDYEQLTGRALNDIWFFDLYRCFWAVLETEHYLEGVRDLGLRNLKLSEVEPRLHRFVTRALEQATTR